MSTRDPVLTFFADYIFQHLGIVYAEHNDFQLQKRLDDIALQLGHKDRETLFAHSKNGVSPDFKQLLLDVATNNETSFFRDSQMYQVLSQDALPVLANKPHIRIWSAACSTGQEPLSIAMTLEDWSTKTKTPLKYSILASDVSERALKKARSGLYSDIETRRGLTAAYQQAYFTQVGVSSGTVGNETWTPREQIRSNITFQNLNLREPFPFNERFDVIFCRNVLIYQEVDGKIAILKELTKALNPGGYLILGFGESLIGLSTDFDRATSGDVVLYRRKAA